MPYTPFLYESTTWPAVKAVLESSPNPLTYREIAVLAKFPPRRVQAALSYARRLRLVAETFRAGRTNPVSCYSIRKVEEFGLGNVKA